MLRSLHYRLGAGETSVDPPLILIITWQPSPRQGPEAKNRGFSVSWLLEYILGAVLVTIELRFSPYILVYVKRVSRPCYLESQAKVRHRVVPHPLWIFFLSL